MPAPSSQYTQSGFESLTVPTHLGAMAYQVSKPTEDSATPETLVFLHGFGGGSSSYEFSQVYPHFAQRYRVVAADLIGWGLSAHPDRTYQVADYTETITEFLTKVCPEPPIVVASSLTAGLVCRLAVVAPERFRKLLLVTPTGLADFGNDLTAPPIAFLAGLPFVDNFIYERFAADRGAIRQFLEQRLFARPERVSEDIVDGYWWSANQPNAERAALSFLRGALSFDLAEFIPSLHTPTHFIWGAQAGFNTLETGRKLVLLNPRLELHVIEDCGLVPQLEKPEQTRALLAKLLE